MLFFLISAGVTFFLLAAVIILYFTRSRTVEDRLMAVTARPQYAVAATLDDQPGGIGGLAAQVTGFLKPARNIIVSDDDEMSRRLAQAGLRKPQHLEIYTAAKMLLPIVAIVASTFAGSSWAIVAAFGFGIGFIGPDLVVMNLTSRRKEAISRSLPDALDLLVICMEAGLGIDQALVRVGDDIKLTCPPLADEFTIINREQRAGKPRLEAWRSMSDRVEIDFVRQFVSMLVQTERFGTPIAQALGSFADSMRTRRMQLVEEAAAKTGVKLLFPLVLFIFPSIFVVLLGPAILNVMKTLGSAFQ